MTTHRHQNKHISAALKEAEEAGWRIERRKGSGHAWGRMYCPYGHPECAVTIYGTPRTPEYHAEALRRAVRRCPGPNDLEEVEFIRRLKS